MAEDYNVDVKLPKKPRNLFPNIDQTTPNIAPSNNEWELFVANDEYQLFRDPAGVSFDTRRIQQINRFHLQTHDTVLGTKSFVFMTRPNLNLIYYGELLAEIKRIQLFTYIYGIDQIGPAIFESLEVWGASRSPTPWLSVLTNQIRSYAPIDAELDTTENGETYHGHKIIYGKHNFKSEIGGTTSLTFQDTRDLLVYLTLKTWRKYINCVSSGLCYPANVHVKKAELDYATSLYYIVVKEDMEEIVYWEKLTGVFPTKVPDSIFNYVENEPERNLKFDIDFAYSCREVMNPAIFVELNRLYQTADINTIPLPTPPMVSSRNWLQRMLNIGKEITEANVQHWYNEAYGTNPEFLPNYIPSIAMHGVPYVYGPWITQDSNGKYRLRWI